MAYYNHYNLDDIAEEMNAPQELYQTNFIDFPITIQDISRTYIKVISMVSLYFPRLIWLIKVMSGSTETTLFGYPNKVTIDISMFILIVIK